MIVPARARNLADWRRIRRYAVPRRMIEQAAERRAAGDWAGGCRAAGVRVGFDPRSAAHQIRDGLEDDLRHLAPDLLRWHLPRVLDGRTTLVPRQVIVLARFGRWVLHVETPALTEGPQHLTLRLAAVDDLPRSVVHDWTRARHLWDVRHSAELLERCGGGDGRAPFFLPDGTPVPESDLGGAGPAGLTERVTLLQDRDEHKAAFEVVGIELDPTMPDVPSYFRVDPQALWGAVAPSRLARELDRLDGDRYLLSFGFAVSLMIERRGPGRERLRVRLVENHGSGRGVPLLPEPFWRRSPDLELLRHGLAAPDELHPLVRSALFPARPPAEGPVGPPEAEPPEPLRVRCRGEWHLVHVRDGELRIPHGAREKEREAAMQALGGEVSGCFAVQRTWRSGTGRLPRRLRVQRQDLFMRAQHGDTSGVVRLLDAGFDPHVRDGRERTLLHYLHMLDHRELLPRLLDAGLDLEAEDQQGRTPLHLAVGENGTEELIRALLDAGARIDTIAVNGETISGLIERNGRSDLAWLRDRVDTEHPNLWLASADDS